jgi:hypothetical protein
MSLTNYADEADGEDAGGAEGEGVGGGRGRDRK